MKIGNYTLDKSRPAIMGIVNVTPDSFSDGGRFVSPKAAIDHALRLVEEGADIIDIGGESTRPGAEPVSAEEELRRTIPVIEGLRRKSEIPISVDTTKSIVASRAIEAGADMINDISAGRFDPEMLPLAAKTHVPICLMHMQGEPRTMQIAPHYNDLMGEIRSFLSDAIERALRCGIGRERIIIDPGIGFGKSAGDNLTILARLSELATLNAPILIGPSKKSFIGKVLGLELDKRLEATLATIAVAIDGGASLLRVHDVGPSRRFVDMYLRLLDIEKAQT